MHEIQGTQKECFFSLLSDESGLYANVAVACSTLAYLASSPRGSAINLQGDTSTHKMNFIGILVYSGSNIWKFKSLFRTQSNLLHYLDLKWVKYWLKLHGDGRSQRLELN